MTIQNPFVDFEKTRKNFGKYIDLYNSGKPLCQQLRSSHIELFYDLIRVYRRNIGQHTQKFKHTNPELVTVETTNLPHLFTNNKELAIRRHSDPSTIYRQLNRLFEAKVILDKIKHGSRKNYELMFNPALVAIVDMETGNGLSPDAELAFFSNRNAICNPNTVSKLETSNNIIIAKKKEFHSKSSLETTGNNNSKKELHGNSLSKDTKLETKKIGNTPEKERTAPPSQQKKKSSGGSLSEYSKEITRLDKKIKKTRQQFSAWLVSLMIDALLQDHTVFPGEIDRTVEYVSENYFNHLHSFRDLDRQMDIYREQILLAKKYKAKHPDYQSPFPYRYFDVTNHVNGFIATRAWAKKHIEHQKIKKYRRHLAEQNKLSRAVRKFNDSPTQENYEKQRAYVKTNISHLLPAFEKMVKSDTILNER